MPMLHVCARAMEEEESRTPIGQVGPNECQGIDGEQKEFPRSGENRDESDGIELRKDRRRKNAMGTPIPSLHGQPERKEHEGRWEDVMVTGACRFDDDEGAEGIEKAGLGWFAQMLNQFQNEKNAEPVANDKKKL